MSEQLHLSDNDLVLHYYGEDVARAARTELPDDQPSARNRIRLAIDAAFASCVTITMV